MALRLLVSSAAKIVCQSSKIARSPGEQHLMKYLLSNSSRTCTACYKLPQLQFSTTPKAAADDTPAPAESSQTVDTVLHDLDGLVGHGKAEIEAFHQGISDPWEWDPIDHGYGSRQNPILVPTQLDGRDVACMCEGEDGTDASFMMLTWDDPIQRCGECGNVYKLIEGPAFKMGPIDGEDHYADDHH